MAEGKNNGFPGGSKGRVNRAGERVRAGTATPEDLAVIDEWRAAHRDVLNTFQAILRFRSAVDEDVSVAQRHKRKLTIFNKLQREPNMQLSRMDDIAGCRVIFKTAASLYFFRADLHRARFKHKLRSDINKYDYIQHPKITGYRGVHDVYAYDVNSEAGKRLRGLNVEIQYRTLVQHAWATAVEIIGIITTSQPKFQQGDKRYQQAMALASEILARAFEESKGCFPDLSDDEVVRRFKVLDEELGLLKMLRNLNATDEQQLSKNRNTILIGHAAGDVEVKTFRDSTDALSALFELEKQFPGGDIVYVKSDKSEDVRLAFKNYFRDAKDFIRLVEGGCASLAPFQSKPGFLKGWFRNRKGG